MVMSILDSAIIGGGLFGLIGIIYPKFLYRLTNAPTEHKYNNKEAMKYRFWGFIILISSVVFYIYDNYFH